MSGIAPRFGSAALALCGVLAGGGCTYSPPGAPDATADHDSAQYIDGPPMRMPCTNSFGTEMTDAHGRLDGILVSVVDPSHVGCASDSTHVHLQVRSNGAVYDSAVNVDGGFYLTKDIAMPGIAWTEGWHTDQPFDYTQPAVDVHSTDFQAADLGTMNTMVEDALVGVNHISIYMTGYNANGGHLVHREGTDIDGTIIIDPLSATSHAILFRFSTDSF